MADKLTKLGSAPEQQELKTGKEQGQAGNEGKEILETKMNVSEGVNVLSENAEEGGVFSEDEQKVKDSAKAGTSTTVQKTTHASVKQLPPVDVMIKETVEAIETELKKTEEEVRTMMRNKNSSAYVLNDKVKKIRFLNGLLSELKRAAKMAEEYVVGLWKQFVGKSS